MKIAIARNNSSRRASKDHVQYLLRLCELELIEREHRMIERRIQAAKFPTTKSLRAGGLQAFAPLE